MGVVGFTRSQRQFFLRAFGFRCAWHYKQEGKWIRCKNTTRLEVHHIYPRGWCDVNMPNSFDVNSMQQGIVLCRYHHWKVHPDMIPAYAQYKTGNKSAFANMIQKRRRLNEQGIPYWDTTWDLMFIRLNLKFTVLEQQKSKYPKRKSRRQ